jgi:hypothetical protein
VVEVVVMVVKVMRNSSMVMEMWHHPGVRKSHPTTDTLIIFVSTEVGVIYFRFKSQIYHSKQGQSKDQGGTCEDFLFLWSPGHHRGVNIEIITHFSIFVISTISNIISNNIL